MSLPVLSFQQIADLPEKAHVSAFNGTFDKITAIVPGSDYTIQNCTVLDERGKKLKVKLKNRPELTEAWIGTYVHFEARPGQRTDCVGLWRAKDDEYKGNKMPAVFLDDRADFVPFDPAIHSVAATDVAPPPPGRSTQQAPPPPGRSTQQAQPPTGRSTQQAPPPRQQQSPPQQTHTPEPPPNTPSARPSPKFPKPGDSDYQPLGQTVGMAVNNACASLTAQGRQLEPTEVWNIASDILRICSRLEHGQVAPPYSERVKANAGSQKQP